MWTVFRKFVKRLAAQRKMSAILKEKKKLQELERLVLLEGRGKGLGSTDNGRRRL